MVSPTPIWGIHKYDTTAPVAPIEAFFNTQADDLETALNNFKTAVTTQSYLQYTTKALMDAAPGTVQGQHATVTNDTTTPTNNGDYLWDIPTTKWVFFGTVEAVITPAVGWTAGTGPNTPRLKRVGKLVTAFGSLTWAGGGAYATMFTAPAAFMPPTTTAARDIGAARQVTGSTIILAQMVLNTTGIVGNGTGASGSLPASGTVFLSGLSWWID